MLQNVESQKKMHKNFEEALEPCVMMAKVQIFGRPNQRGNVKKKENGKRKTGIAITAKSKATLRKIA